MNEENATDLLQRGIAAARAGQRQQARGLLARAAELSPENVAAWLWLAGVAETPEAQAAALERALALEPENARARRALAALHAQWARRHIQAGDRARAREHLLQAVDLDEDDAETWWALSQVVETPEEREICLDNVLTLDPGHAPAQAARAALAEALAQPSPPPPAEAEIAPEAPDMSAWDFFEDELRCPSCGTPTEFEDRYCAACARALWARRREVPRITTSYRILVALEALFALAGLLLPLLLLTYVGMHLALDNRIFDLLPVYAGSVEVPDAVAEEIFALVPRGQFWLSLLPSALSLLLLPCVLSRWQPFYAVALVLGGTRTLAGVSSLVLVLSGGLGGPVTLGLPGNFKDIMRTGIALGDIGVVLLSGIALALLIAVQNHFTVEDRRLLLRLDADVVGNEAALWLRGREYAKEKRWAAAALHLRRALALEERLESYLMLALAYGHLGLDAAAQTALADAQRLSPGNPQIEEMRALLAQMAAKPIAHPA